MSRHRAGMRRVYPLGRLIALPALALMLVVGCRRRHVEDANTIVLRDRGHRIDRIVSADSGFSGTVLAMWQGETVLAKGYGVADPETDVPNSPTTVFDMGSVVKDFTTASILHLESSEVLRTSDSLAVFFPDIAEDKANITLDQVLRMRAGFHEYHDETGDFQQMDREEAIGRILAQELLFEPGTETAYSNSGYTLLAAIVELVSGETYEQYVRTALLGPADMASAGFYGDGAVTSDRVAVGHGGFSRMGDKNAPPLWPHVTWALAGSGGVYGSVLDLANWREAVERGRILQGPALEKYYTYRTARPDAVGRRIRFSAGGNDFGFVFVSIELVDENGLLIFAQNNNATGEEDPLFVRALLEAFRR